MVSIWVLYFTHHTTLALLYNRNSLLKILQVSLAMISPVKRWSLTELDVDKGTAPCLPGTKTLPGITLDSVKILFFFLFGALNSRKIFHHFYDHLIIYKKIRSIGKRTLSLLCIVENGVFVLAQKRAVLV